MNDWTAVIPVKRLGLAKSRLRGAVPDARHQDLALALVRDTVTAVLACAEVAELLVVTDDPAVTAAVAELGAYAVPDRPAAGLNAALRFGADVVAGLSVRRAVLAGDLPALRPAELASALRDPGDLPALRPAELASALRDPGDRPERPVEFRTTRSGRRRYVPDAEGSGTVLLTAPPGVALDPRFGVGSAAAHAISGAQPVLGDWPGLRHDVDTAADLGAVLALGPGDHTCALLRDLARTADCGAPGPRTARAR